MLSQKVNNMFHKINIKENMILSAQGWASLTLTGISQDLNSYQSAEHLKKEKCLFVTILILRNIFGDKIVQL